MPVTTIADLLTSVTREPGRPRLTWYGVGGERVELSGAVLENWVNKTANLLVEEFDAGPGTQVLVDLPGHWRAVVWALATWRVGACVVLGESDAVQVVVTDEPGRHDWGGADLIAVSLPALARRFDGPLPAGAVDAAAAVMTYADVLGWTPPLQTSSPAVVGAGPSVPHSALLARQPVAGRRLLRLTADGPDLRTALEHVLETLHGNGSVVMVDERAGEWDDDRLSRLAQTERVDALA